MGSKLEDLNLTPEEVDRFSKAFKDEKFREMLREYAEEISNPESKKKYEEEITLMEQERGMDIKFVHPKPERVLRTSLDGKQKCFLNVCSNDLIGKPECRTDKGADGRIGQHWSLPYSVAPGRPDLDSKGNKYIIYDVVFHPDTLYIAAKNSRFMKLVESTAIQGVQDQFKVKLDEKNVKILKIKYKGTPHPTVIRKPLHGRSAKVNHAEPNDPLSFPYPYDNTNIKSQNVQERPKPNTVFQNQTKGNQEDSENSKKPTEPHYTVKYRSYIDLQDYRCSRDSAPGPRPKEIVITIHLPLLKSSENADLNVTEKKMILESQKPAYRLELPLAYPVDENKGEAKFNKLKRQLVVTLPVLPLTSPLLDGVNVVCGKSNDETAQCPDKGEGEGEGAALELSDQPAHHEMGSTAAVCSSPSDAQSFSSEKKQPLISFENSDGSELTVDVIVETKECLSCTSSGESGCRTDTSKTTDLNYKEALPGAKHTEAAAGCEENFNEEEEDDISHQSLDNVVDEKSKAASVTPPNLGCGVQDRACSHGAEDTGEKHVHSSPGSDPGPMTGSAPQSVLAKGQGCQDSVPTNDRVTTHFGAHALIDVIQSQPSQGTAGVDLGGTDEVSPAAKGGEPCNTGSFSDATATVEKEKGEVNTDHPPNNQSLKLVGSEHGPVVLIDDSGEDGKAEAIRDHSTSAAFSFQNSLLYELD